MDSIKNNFNSRSKVNQYQDDYKMNNMMQPRSIYNPWSSFSVNLENAQVMLKICQILSNYNEDIEYKVNSDQYKIDGIIFMTDHNHVFFMISIYKDKGDGNQENMNMNYMNMNMNMNMSMNKKIGSKNQELNLFENQEIQYLFRDFVVTLKIFIYPQVLL